MALLLVKEDTGAEPGGGAIVAVGIVANEVGAKTARELTCYAREQPWAPGATAAVKEIPAGASVASQDFLYPHLAVRETADVIRPGMAPTRYLVVNPFVESGAATGNPGGFSGLGDQLRRTLPLYKVVWERDGWLVLERRRGADPSNGALSAELCARLARRARSGATAGNAPATVQSLCRQPSGP